MSRTTRRIVLVVLLLLAALAFMGIRAASAQVVPGPRGNPIVDQRSYARPQPRQTPPRGGQVQRPAQPRYRSAPNYGHGGGYRRAPYGRSYGSRYHGGNRGRYNGSPMSRYGYGGRGRSYGYNRGYGYGYGYGYGTPYLMPQTCWSPGGIGLDPYTGQLMILPGYPVPCGAW